MHTTTQAIQIKQTGGPEVMQLVELELGAPGPGEVQIRQYACGINYIDVYFRTGLYPQPLPAGLGMEGAGEVLAIGPGVENFQPGQRVAYAGRPTGGYASLRNVPAAILVHRPEHVSYEEAAAVMLQGLTVQYLFCRTRKLQAGDKILFHAAAGGVGLLACQWARALGVEMIGTVGSDAKAELALAQGCSHVINYNTENFVQRVREITDGAGVSVVYDSIGADTFLGSLDCLSPFGLMVSFGNASGPIPPVDLKELTNRGSLFLTRPTLFAHTAKRADLEAMANDLFAMLGSGAIKVQINHRYALADVAQAHRELEARATTGSAILIP